MFMYKSVSILHVVSQEASNELINLKINIEHLYA
jgi:hypothetical protein